MTETRDILIEKETLIDEVDLLQPRLKRRSLNLFAEFLSIIKALIYFILGLLGVIAFLIATLSGIGPMIEYFYSQRDKKILRRNEFLKRHSGSMFLLEIPGGINQASIGKPYNVMVRLTKPLKNQVVGHLPPVVLPGGLAANLIAMARHQDILTEKYGFTVLNFDRLGVGLSDPNTSGISPSAKDVACELDYVMRHCGVDDSEKWIQVGGSMGTNVATAFACLFPHRLCGFFNLDGLPHGFLPIKCQKFLETGPQVSNVTALLWTGIFRFVFAVLLRNSIIRGGWSKSFSPEELIAVMIQPQQWRNTALEYATLMSCCDIEIAALGPQATTALSLKDLYQLATLAPDESVKVDEMNEVPREVITERSNSELGDSFTSRDSTPFTEFWGRFSAMALKSPTDINSQKTHCTWPDPPKHPVGERVGGVEESDVIYPLADVFSNMVVRVMTARDYSGLEGDYTQDVRNHSMAKSNLQKLLAKDGLSYVYPFLNHGNLWQQSEEIARITYEMALVIEGKSNMV